MMEGYEDKGAYYYKEIKDQYGDMAIYIYKTPQKTKINDNIIIYDRLEVESFFGALDNQYYTYAFYYLKGELIKTDF